MLEYREINLSMLPQLSRLFAETFNAAPWKENWSQETAAKRLHQIITTEDFFGLGVYENGELCGMIMGCKEQYDERMIFQAREFCIRNTMQGCGLGTEIYRHLEEELKKQGIHRIFLYTIQDKMTEKFYEKQGFKRSPDLMLMEKEM